MAKKIALIWKDNCSFEDGFKIERSANGSTGWSVIDSIVANSETYDDLDVDFGETWFYRVRAFDGSLLSAYTNVATATVPSLIDPLAEPNLLVALMSNTGMGAYSNGSLISNWPDQSGFARDAVTLAGFTQPTYDTTILTPLGLPTVKWSAVITALANASNFDWIAANGHTIHWYGRTETKTVGPYPFVNQVMFSPITIGKPVAVAHDGGGTGKYGFVDDAGGGGPKVFGTHASIVNQWHLHSIVMPLPNNNTIPGLYYLDGVLKSQTGGATNYQSAIPSNAQYMVGGNSTGNTSFKGNQGFLFLYAGTQNQAKITDFANLAEFVWGF